MENELIDRVATALMAETARQIRAGEEPALGNSPRLLARAAIEAMREPSGEQERVMNARLGPDAPATRRWHWVWQEMIDAALGKVPA